MLVDASKHLFTLNAYIDGHMYGMGSAKSHLHGHLNIRGELDQYQSWWSPGSVRHHTIANMTLTVHDKSVVCLHRGMLSTICNILVQTNEKRCNTFIPLHAILALQGTEPFRSASLTIVIYCYLTIIWRPKYRHFRHFLKDLFLYFLLKWI